MVRAHRQAWCWQDEWVGLTMEDIRRIEKETQEILAQKMAEANKAAEEEGEGGSIDDPNATSNDNQNQSSKEAANPNKARKGSAAGAAAGLNSPSDEEFFDADG